MRQSHRPPWPSTTNSGPPQWSSAGAASSRPRLAPADVLTTRDSLKHHHEQQMVDASSEWLASDPWPGNS
ncbi:hypothetical protein [Streptomyces europaeiscabiei]|uniref:hypothetical protein n=1 Tax=Streptomyces europaeiscabiei TaxID=146819 RepID=UPI0038F7CF46